MVYGRLVDLRGLDDSVMDKLVGQAEYLRTIFGRNASLCSLVGISVISQVNELRSMYGIKVSVQVMSELRNGKRFKCGFTLIMCLRDYWSKRGMFLDLN